MTDNDIIKALECCLGEHAMCDVCPYEKTSESVRGCMDNLLEDTFSLINRQKVEIDFLRASLKRKAN